VRSIGWLQKKYLIRIVASLLFIATAGILFHYFTKRDSTTITQYASITASDSTAMEHLLPDGSKAWLFPGSSIHIPANYNEQNRHVQVTGRAFFDVKQDVSKPFYVDAGSIQTRVLGTSFEVNMLRGKFPAVVVKSGRVAVSWEGKELSQLSVNKRITLDLSGPLPHAAVDSVNATALCTWWSGAFNFEQTPLTEVVENLSQWYRMPIAVQGKKWKNEKLTIQIETQLGIEETMRLLCETLGAQYKMNGQSISIY
jgi:ferric-dicitrate binding protein FerR (iron transport regulator)